MKPDENLDLDFTKRFPLGFLTVSGLRAWPWGITKTGVIYGWAETLGKTSWNAKGAHLGMRTPDENGAELITG